MALPREAGSSRGNMHVASQAVKLLKQLQCRLIRNMLFYSIVTYMALVNFQKCVIGCDFFSHST